jgi:hypothetical protein
MAELSSREVVERFAKALRDNDLDMQDALLHDDVSDDSGYHAAWRAPLAFLE